MKKIFTLFAMLTLFVSMMAQAPKFNYQAVLRDPTSKELVRNQEVDANVFIPVNADYQDTLFSGTVTTNSDGMLNLTLEADDVNWADVSGIVATFTYYDNNIQDDQTIEIYTPVTPVPYAFHADNYFLTTESIENYLGSGVDGEDVAQLHEALKSNEAFHDAARDTVVEYIKDNYEKAKEIAYDYLRQVQPSDVNEFYSEAQGLSQEVKDSIYSAVKEFLKDNRAMLVELAKYYAETASADEVQQLYQQLQASPTASAKVRSLLDSYFEAYLIRKGLICDGVTPCTVIQQIFPQ